MNHPSAGRGQTIQIFLPSGDATSLRIASIPTRTVQVFDIPRSDLAEFLGREEADRPGVYFLFGGAEERPKAYIGQSSQMNRRLVDHNKKKDFWERAVVAVSSTNEWSQTHIAFLEWESIRLARRADRYDLDNVEAGSLPHTPDPLKADCAEYLDTIKQLVSTLGYPVMNRPKRAPSPVVTEPAENGTTDDGIKVFMKGRGTNAEGVYSSEGLLVLTGSTGKIISNSPRAHIAEAEAKIRELAAAGVVEVNPAGDGHTFIKDHLFSSPSGASKVLVCGSSNGREAFRNASGRTIAQFES